MASSGGSKTLMILVTHFHMGTLRSQLLLMPQKRAEFENIATGGHWAENESRPHINVLELTAGFIGLKTFAKKKENIHIR